MLTPEQKKHIHDALDNSFENGYDPEAMTVDELVADLMDLDNECETMEASDVEAGVRSWIELHATVLR